MAKSLALCGLLLAASAICLASEEPNYLIGRGMYDMTGPAGEINFMGYANPAQTGKGIHTRQFSRAFIITDPQSNRSTVFVSIDACMASQVVTTRVLERLSELYGDRYTAENVIISGTHTHSAPAGFFQYVMFDITSIGISPLSIAAYVNGITRSIQMAHNNIQPGYILMNSGILLNASRNRSPTSYLRNPAEERAKYEHDTDKLMTVLKLQNAVGEDLGMINWFAVHCTSMNNTNTLVSSDNKGYASLLFEEMMNPESLPGHGEFVAAFAQSNLGDVSPNIMGAHCRDTGLPCESNHSTCGGKTELCVADGPGKDMMDSTRIIGLRQFEKAKELYKEASIRISGPIDFRMSYLHMTNQTVEFNGTTAHTCKPAMGYSFAAGTTDGPGAFDFTQGTTKGNPFWNAISHLLKSPTKEQAACQHPKPILLDTGEMHEPFEWAPSTVAIQIVRIGQLLIAAVPGEFTTMAGRRLRDAIKNRVVSMGYPEDTTVVIAGLSSSYADYITTYEEYQAQRYEAASTVYGPHTLNAYIQNFERIATDLAKGAPSESDPPPPNDKHAISKYTYPFPVIYDGCPFGTHIGGLIEDVKPTYHVGDDVVVSFHAGNPRNNLMTDKTFLTVEQQLGNDDWKIVHQDSSWHTEFHWLKSGKLESHSTAKIVWHTAGNAQPGTYRIRHFGFYHPLAESPIPYNGTSSAFKIQP